MQGGAQAQQAVRLCVRADVRTCMCACVVALRGHDGKGRRGREREGEQRGLHSKRMPAHLFAEKQTATAEADPHAVSQQSSHASGVLAEEEAHTLPLVGAQAAGNGGGHLGGGRGVGGVGWVGLWVGRWGLGGWAGSCMCGFARPAGVLGTPA